MSKEEPQRWHRHQSESKGHYRVFEIFERRFQHATDGRADNFYVMEMADWVLALPLTSEGKIVLVNQFRFGTEAFSWEPPGGVVDAEDTDYVVAAVREMVEETGYTGRDAREIGWCHPNPALQINRAHFVIVEDCRQTHELNLDLNEEIQVREFTLDEAFRMAADGRISHAIAQAALLHLKLWLESRSAR